MRKSIWHLSRCAAVCTVFLFVQQAIQSQVSNPSTWDSFTQSSSNLSVRDTFRMQTFEELASDNWSYSTTGETSIEDISETNIPDDPEQPGRGHGTYGLRMPMNSQVAFEHFPLTSFQNIIISVRKGGIHLMPKEAMQAKTYRPDKPEYESIITITTDNATSTFKTTDIGSNPPGLDLIVPAPAANTRNGYYYVDSVYAHGMIPSYSLFTGDGDWSDTASWSHLPALRHRNALINGNIAVNTNINCGDLFIGEGSIRISPTGELSAKNLTIYSNDNSVVSSSSALRSSGTIDIAGKVTIEKTFTQKGKWYFISFPFDVYASGIDPGFQLGDNHSDTNGNYFYLQTYNGEKRANSQSLSDNWEVIPQTILSTTQPLFKKNKGYLIAIDASADRQTLRFSSKAGDIPIDFGKSGQASIQITINSQSTNQNHNGWFLCGNPLPSPLPLAQIEPNSSLDGYIYIYDGSTYQSYAIGSDFAIPPFSAFFVKASKNTLLSVHSASEPASYKLVSTKAPLSFPTSEPQARQETLVSNLAPSSPKVRYHVKSKTLLLENLPSSGKVELFTPAGVRVFAQTVQTGNSTLPLALPQGLYILIIQTEQDRAQYKCVLTP